ncbi:hypothetical protein QWY86_04645 [Pedobacter aquatilis]|uniref:hypothetical protein n=1 Tax=Pedobacter aquatilis TaxID=351343 RepID=UPI0025B384DB|nr:hypothetical protein [Pedobacter aquatilis]MDN3585943.1 hypothetical protein [Pedobacter aquatilis]
MRKEISVCVDFPDYGIVEVSAKYELTALVNTNEDSSFRCELETFFTKGDTGMDHREFTFLITRHSGRNSSAVKLLTASMRHGQNQEHLVNTLSSYIILNELEKH